ncbi:MAG: leucyl aminopeptidase [Campylobacteraceae bacterium]|jgi:leucyl aminopeptidase|nr:leucyl aminopeptidase [Campylobacteraceae bacterium]
MDIKIINETLENIDAQAVITFIVNKNFNHTWVKHKKILENVNFKAESEDGILLAENNHVYIGCENLQPDELRLAAAKAFKLLRQTSYKSVKIGSYVEETNIESMGALIEGFVLGSYEFTKYKSKTEPFNLQEIIISTENYNQSKVSFETLIGVKDNAQIIANAANYAKEIVNTAPYDYTPIQMAEDALKLSAIEGVTCEIFDEKFLEKEKMGAFLAVNRASVHPPRLIHLTYKPKEKPKRRVVFVGKGLTYDSGGLSLKPSDYMVTMKADKSGGAAVMAILKGAAELRLPFEIHAIIGATENMIGANAYKPDDILRAKNGKTIEVRNTDAEGRLVLADCLVYAQELRPDLLIDMATLTGACVVALGEYTTGVMGHNEKLKHELFRAAAKSGELVNALSFNRYLKKLLKSTVADISNISSSRYGGAITAALFLDNFIEEEYKDKWLHLDIAGPAFVEKDWGYNQSGASGAGVRMNLYWLMLQNQNEDKQ